MKIERKILLQMFHCPGVHLNLDDLDWKKFKPNTVQSPAGVKIWARDTLGQFQLTDPLILNKNLIETFKKMNHLTASLHFFNRNECSYRLAEFLQGKPAIHTAACRKEPGYCIWLSRDALPYIPERQTTTGVCIQVIGQSGMAKQW